jgi:adenine-specific DNA-methyltransferase
MPTLNWIGKEKVVKHHLDVPFRILEPSYIYGDQEDAAQNKIINGDNLEALKSLLPEYEGKIKCIYIDPPYNTGNEGWVYNDNVNHPKIRKWLGEVVGKEGEDLSRHDKWLCMMYPRLKLLHRLLSEDGAIFISIDDNEIACLRLLMDEIFGKNSFVTNVIWQKVYSPKNSAKYFSEDHDYILVYSKSINQWDRNLLPQTESQLAAYKNPDNDYRGPWKPSDLSARNPYSQGIYPITTPSGRLLEGPPQGRYWSISKETLELYDKDNRIWWGKDGNNIPALKRFLSEVQPGRVPQTLWKYEEVGHTQDAKKESLTLLGKEPFNTPKPVKLIDRILRIATGPDDVVLDSFAGSGTTAHAVLNLNKEDGGNRKFILVELEDYADSITAERVKRVIDGYGSNGKEVEGTGGGFTFYELGKPLFLSDGSVNEDVSIDKLKEYIYFTETKKQLPEAHPENPYFLGSEDGNSYYLLHEHEKALSLDYDFLSTLVQKDEAYIIYADRCLIDDEFMRKHNIIFKKVPRDIVRF